MRAMDLEQLRRDGYTVVEGVAGPEQIEPLLALAQEASGVVLDDPSTWDPDGDELLKRWDHQAQWDLRQHPPLYEAFAAAYGERDLGVSRDRIGVKVPGRRGMRIHHDVEPHSPPRVFGGLVYLTDTPPERGASPRFSPLACGSRTSHSTRSPARPGTATTSWPSGSTTSTPAPGWRSSQPAQSRKMPGTQRNAPRSAGVSVR